MFFMKEFVLSLNKKQNTIRFPIFKVLNIFYD